MLNIIEDAHFAQRDLFLGERTWKNGSADWEKYLSDRNVKGSNDCRKDHI